MLHFTGFSIKVKLGEKGGKRKTHGNRESHPEVYIKIIYKNCPSYLNDKDI